MKLVPLDHLQIALICQFDLGFVTQGAIETDEDVFSVVLAGLVGVELEFEGHRSDFRLQLQVGKMVI